MTSLDRVLLAGGGTAGHVAPMLATADEIARRHPDAVITAVGSPGGIEERLVPERGYPLAFVAKVAFPRRPNAAALRFPLAFRGALAEARELLERHDPQVVVGFGGYVTTPVYLAARRAGVPVVVHEQNARPGLANKLGARWAAHVAVTFASTPMPGAEVIGMPLRREITDLRPAILRAEALEFFGLDAGRPTVLVTGGSLGAASINRAFEARVGALNAAGIQVLHITGRGKGFAVPTMPAGPRYVVVEYVDRMDLAYSVADLVVTRSGAGMVCELATVGLPAIYVPLPIGNGEQKLNSRDVVAAGGALVVDDAQFTPEWINTELVPLVRDEARLAEMRAAAAGQGHAQASGRLVDLVENAATGARSNAAGGGAA